MAVEARALLFRTLPIGDGGACSLGNDAVYFEGYSLAGRRVGVHVAPKVTDKVRCAVGIVRTLHREHVLSLGPLASATSGKEAEMVNVEHLLHHQHNEAACAGA